MSEARNGGAPPKAALPDSMIDPSGATIWQRGLRTFGGAAQALGGDIGDLARGIYAAGPGTFERVWTGELPPGAPETEAAARQTAATFGFGAAPEGALGTGKIIPFGRGAEIRAEQEATERAARQRVIEQRFEEMRSRLLPQPSYPLPSEIKDALKYFEQLGFDSNREAIAALRQSKASMGDWRSSWDIRPNSEFQTMNDIEKARDQKLFEQHTRALDKYLSLPPGSWPEGTTFPAAGGVGPGALAGAAPSGQRQSPFQEAMSSMSLTPPEQYLYWHHLSNLLGPGKVINPDNRVSTILQAVVDGPHGLYYNIPTVWNGQILDEFSAKQMAAQAGWDKWPAYSTPEQADARYEQMHAFIERDTEDYMGLKQ